MVTPARIAALLFGPFGIPPPAFLPPPAPPERFPSVFAPLYQEALMTPVAADTATPAVADALPPPPALPPGAPSLARRLHAALCALCRTWNEDVIETTTDTADLVAGAYHGGLAALAALPTLKPPTVSIGDKTYYEEEDGSLTPEGVMKPQRVLEDDFVRTVALGALAVNGSLSRYKKMTLSEGYGLLGVLGQDYGDARVNAGTRVTFHTVRRDWRVEIASADRIAFGPTIVVAQSLLNEWVQAEEGSEVLKAAITSAFGLDDQGRLRVSEVLRLRRYKIDHPKWRAAMEAIADAMVVTGAREYVRIYQRQPDGSYRQIPLDLAGVGKEAAPC